MALLQTPLALDPTKYPTLDRYTGNPLPNGSRPITYGVKANSLVMEFDGGTSQRRAKSQPKTTIEFKYNALSQTEYRTLRDFFLLVTNVQPFTYIDPLEKQPYRVTFNQDVFAATNQGHGPAGAYYSLEVKLVQSFD